jgi:hypothetical protein
MPCRYYKTRPTPKRARRVWDYAQKKYGKTPVFLIKNPNCWQAGTSVVGNAWGWWYVEFENHQGINIHPSEVGK